MKAVTTILHKTENDLIIIGIIEYNNGEWLHIKASNKMSWHIQFYIHSSPQLPDCMLL